MFPLFAPKKVAPKHNGGHPSVGAGDRRGMFRGIAYDGQQDHADEGLANFVRNEVCLFFSGKMWTKKWKKMHIFWKSWSKMVQRSENLWLFYGKSGKSLVQRSVTVVLWKIWLKKDVKNIRGKKWKSKRDFLILFMTTKLSKHLWCSKCSGWCCYDTKEWIGCFCMETGNPGNCNGLKTSPYLLPRNNIKKGHKHRSNRHKLAQNWKLRALGRPNLVLTPSMESTKFSEQPGSRTFCASNRNFSIKPRRTSSGRLVPIFGILELLVFQEFSGVWMVYNLRKK